MNRGLILAVGLLAVGCSNDPPPIREATPIATPEAKLAEFAPPAKPAASDPAAAKLVTAALAAHGASDPTALAKLKTASLHRTCLTTAGVHRVPMDWRADLLTPGLYRVAAEVRVPEGAIQFTSIITPSAGSETRHSLPPLPKVAIEGERLKDCFAQRAEDELLLLYPLADPATVAVPAPLVTLNGVEASGVYVWTPALSPALVHFDGKTGRIARVVYQGRESAKEVLKEITVRELQPFDGVWLASKYLLTINGRPFMDVEKQTYELGKTFPPDHFKP